MTDQKKRQPAGVPIGGEFAANEHDEAPSGLSVGRSEGVGDLFADTENPGLLAFQESENGLIDWRPEYTEERAKNAAAWVESHFDRRGEGWEELGGLSAEHREEALSVLRHLAQESGEGDYSDAMRRERRTQVRTIGMRRNRDDFELTSLRIGGTEIAVNRHELEAWGNAMLARAREIREDSDMSPHPTAALATAAAARYQSYLGERAEEPEHERRELQKMRDELTSYLDAYPEPADPSLYTAEQRQQWREDRTLDERDAVQRIDRALGMLDWQQGKKS